MDELMTYFDDVYKEVSETTGPIAGFIEKSALMQIIDSHAKGKFDPEVTTCAEILKQEMEHRRPFMNDLLMKADFLTQVIRLRDYEDYIRLEERELEY